MIRTAPMGLLALMALPGCAADRTAKTSVALTHQCALPATGPAIDPAEQTKRLAQTIASHEQLRTFSNSPLPQADTMVLVFFGRAHHETQQLSYVATRDPAGWWRLNKAGRFQSEFDTGPSAYPNEITNIAPEKAAAIDALIADPCLYIEPTPDNAGIPPIGVWSTQVAIVTPQHIRVVGINVGKFSGLLGQLVAIVTGWQ